MKILVAVPCPASVSSRWWSRLEAWRDECSYPVKIFPEVTPNRMDWSVSMMIAQAKKDRPGWLVRLDADVRPETPLDACIEMAEENWQAARAITGARWSGPGFFGLTATRQRTARPEGA